MLQNKKEAACINMLSTFFFWSNMLSTLIDTKQLLLLELTFKPNSSLKLREIAFRAHKFSYQYRVISILHYHPPKNQRKL